MAPTTVTTILMVMFALVVIAWGLLNLFGNWDPAMRAMSHEERMEIEYQKALEQMRREIDDYENGKHSL